MFGNVLGIARCFASGPEFGSDAPRSNNRIYRLRLDPRIKEGTPDDFSDTGGGRRDTGGGRQSPTDGIFCVGLTLKHQLKATTRCFSRYFPRPNATLFVVTRPTVHDAMSMLVPDRWIFLAKAACRAFSYGRERACRFKSNIPRKIKSDGLLCKALPY